MPIKPEMRGYLSDRLATDQPARALRARRRHLPGMRSAARRDHSLSARRTLVRRPRHTWRNGRGRPARWPDLEETAQLRQTRVVLAAAHLDHDPRNNRLRNLKSLCQRCHVIHDRPHHLAQRRITYLLRRALGDLFLGSSVPIHPTSDFRRPALPSHLMANALCEVTAGCSEQTR
jgi:hypothetical protein